MGDRLPQGVQLIGPRFRENLVLDAPQAVEDRAPSLTPIQPCDSGSVRPGANVAEIVAIRGPRWPIPDLWETGLDRQEPRQKGSGFVPDTFPVHVFPGKQGYGAYRDRTGDLRLANP